MIIYLNGDYVDQDDVGISIADRGFTLGDGVFETLFYDGREIECLKPHFDRLVKGANLFQLSFGLVISEFKAILMNVIDANGLTGASSAIRFTLTRGAGGRGLAIHKGDSLTTQLVSVNPYQRRAKLSRVGFSRYCFKQPIELCGVKHLGYQLSILGRLEADGRGLDDVLFFNENGHLVCATAANVFIIHQGRLVTPPLSDGCLPGVMRGKIILEMQKSEAPVRIDHINKLTLEEASQILLCNSLIGSAAAVLEKT